jgi:hypothetical protein
MAQQLARRGIDDKALTRADRKHHHQTDQASEDRAA